MQQMGAGRTLIDQENRNGNIRERNMSEREGFMKRIVMVVLTVVLLAGCGASSGFSKDSAAASETWEEAKWEEAVEETSEDGYAMTSYDYGKMTRNPEVQNRKPEIFPVRKPGTGS